MSVELEQSMDDQKLIEGVISKDAKSQEAFYNKYASRMYALCLRYARHQMEAEDLLQEGFIKVYAHIHEFKFNGSLEGWIRKVFTNLALNVVNKKQFKNELYVADNNFRIESNEISIIDKLSEQELITLISTLPIGYRTIFNLYVIDGYSHFEIAEMLEITESTSRSQLTKAKKSLRELLINKENHEYNRRIG